MSFLNKKISDLLLISIEKKIKSHPFIFSRKSTLKKNRMGNTEDTLATLGTQDTGLVQMKINVII